jgi:hypothetical protein
MTITGVEVVSHTILYMDVDKPIKSSDDVIFDGIRQPIVVVKDFYKHDGTKDLLVVYL